ncbi:MAG TPA: zf-TFIIB domain-containing protein, partial [Tepidisphaeraceae bacterium]|nr:zf-TFIIB domain-containing protein [Tepidisphaeraceae bacterium]
HSEMECRDQHGVEIDQCPNCSGVWLDRGELETILEYSSASTMLRDPPESPKQESLNREAMRANLFEWF